MTQIDQRRLAAIGAQLDSIEADLARLARLLGAMPAGQLVAFAATLAEHEHRLDDLVAHAHGGPPPELTVGAQARIARHHLDNQEHQ